MPHLRLTVAAELRVAIDRATVAQDTSLHAWTLAALDAAAGTGPRMRRAESANYSNFLNSSPLRLSLRIPAEQWDSYRLAAGAAALPVVDWCRAVLGVAAGISVLDVQLRRLRSIPKKTDLSDHVTHIFDQGETGASVSCALAQAIDITKSSHSVVNPSETPSQGHSDRRRPSKRG